MIGRVLVTGGAGFVGSNLVRFLLGRRPGLEVVTLDALTYAACRPALRELEGEPRHRFVHGDVCDPALVGELVGECDAIVHLAAESHVDRSIADARPFVATNVGGTHVILEAARARGSVRVLHMSTDEVYGSLPLDRPDLSCDEEAALRPGNPYAATKAAADLLARAYHNTHGVDVVIARCGNNLGPYQYPDKVIPRFVLRLLAGGRAPLYGDGRHVRDWIHVDDCCEALLALLEGGRGGQVYNIAAGNQVSNLELVTAILEVLGLPADRIDHVADRPGHDERYAVATGKLERELGWRPTRSRWPRALAEVVGWYAAHRDWWAGMSTPA